MRQKILPVGLEDYKKIIDGNYYYVDKTMLIRKLRDSGGIAYLFLRPRRFGKTLTLSMLKYFYEDTGDTGRNAANRALFNDMKIMGEPASYRENMTALPVISLTLISAKKEDFKGAASVLKEIIASEFIRHNAIYEGLSNVTYRSRWDRIASLKGDLEEYATSLLFLSGRLHEAYGKKAVILIDEYDVPMENAYFKGYYDKMAGFIRALFESALKTNPSLEFAVLTGCLRVSRESIFTGMNNLLVMSVLDKRFGEYYGFTQDEFDEILRFYQIESRRDELRSWYNGYMIGGQTVYNPWSAVNSVNDIIEDEGAPLKPYWANTSSNDIVRTLAEKSGAQGRAELETLLAGGTLDKPIREDITYADLARPGDNLWNFALFTGYLTTASIWQDGRDIMARLAIPNEEVASIYENNIREWFNDSVRQRDLSGFYKAVVEGNAHAAEDCLRDILEKTISYYDYAENYYHGILAGMFSGMETHIARSNRESGLGRPDMALIPLNIRGTVVIIEIKVCDKAMDMEKEAKAALEQIDRQNYKQEYRDEGYQSFVCYGAAFYKKNIILCVKSA